jgi:hypothetical protein
MEDGATGRIAMEEVDVGQREEVLEHGTLVVLDGREDWSLALAVDHVERRAVGQQQTHKVFSSACRRTMQGRPQLHTAGLPAWTVVHVGASLE